MSKKKGGNVPVGYFAGGMLAFVVVCAAVFAGPVLAQVMKKATEGTLSFARPATSTVTVQKAQIEHIATPEAVKAIYMTQCYGGTPSLRTSLVKLIDETELNSLVLDLKDYSGTVSFPSKKALDGPGCTISDFRDFIKELHEKKIYVIGRLTIFQDPLYTKQYPEEAVQSVARKAPWKDRKGLSFVDVGSRPYRDYIIEIAREAHALGVDEINFDYIRYPSDGNMRDTEFTKTTLSPPEELERFFQELSERMRAGHDGHVPVLSADLFGMTATNVDDLNIGQVLERALPYFDYIAPMVYPSHYPPGFRGYKDVNKHSYDIVQFSMSEAARRAAAATTTVPALTHQALASTSPQLYSKREYSELKMRPWLQDFDYPVAYTPAMVEEQIKATYDAGLTSWMFWDPANRYDSLRQILKPDISS